MNKESMDFFYMSFDGHMYSFPLGVCLGVDLLGHGVVCVYIFQKLPNSFLKWLDHFTLLPAIYLRVPFILHCSPYWSVFFSHCGLVQWYLTEVFICSQRVTMLSTCQKFIGVLLSSVVMCLLCDESSTHFKIGFCLFLCGFYITFSGYEPFVIYCMKCEYFLSVFSWPFYFS